MNLEHYTSESFVVLLYNINLFIKQQIFSNQMLCKVHKLQITHFCHNRSCNTLAMCQECRTAHRTKYSKMSHNADQVPKLQTIQKCRNKLQEDINQLSGIFWKYQSQYKAYEEIQKSRRSLEENKQRILNEIQDFFDMLRVTLEQKNDSLYGNKTNKEMIQRGVSTKAQLEYIRKNLNSEQNVRKAMQFSVQKISKQLKHQSIRDIVQYWVYDNPTFTYQITNPELKKCVLTESASNYLVKPFPNESPLHFLITEPQITSTDDVIHFFDTHQNQLKWYNINDKNWDSLKAPDQLFAFGQTVYDPVTKSFVYLGGTNGKKKSKKVLCYNREKEKWENLRDMIKERSSFSCSLVRSGNSIQGYKNLILIAGGIDNNNNIISDCEFYDIKANTNKNESSLIGSLNFPVACANLCTYSENLVFKFGGMSNNQNFQSISQIIQKYDRKLNNWMVINSDIVLGKFPSEYKLHYANSCSILINPNQIFVFGGYGNDHSGTTQSYIFNVQQFKKNQKSVFKYAIRFVNQKPLPFAQGFTRTKPIIYNKCLYSLQNISQGNSGMMQGQRRLLQFDGFSWSIMQKVYNN